VNGAGFAPAKVNLFLHVGPPRADGFHPICSLMAFADVGDELRAEPASALSLAVDGPFAGAVPAGADNLALRAARALYDRVGVQPPPLRIALTKMLPAEAGLGGGSSDAAAALRLLNGMLEQPLRQDELMALAEGLGSDVPACLLARPALAEGRGERLSPAPALPSLDAVLVKPPAGASTAAVYRAFDAAGVRTAADRQVPPGGALASAKAVAAFLATCRNDLEAPAVTAQPAIGDVLKLLRAQPEALIARMSGSGSACFALCASAASAQALAARLSAARPAWWVRACNLGGTPTSG
jgi:4-diphosphocytidyl-2-C-methyl-D-erythritol kinase